MIVREIDRIDDHKVRVSLAAALIVMGFASTSLYMGSTIFYPVLQFNEFLAQALHNDMQQLLFDRYFGYLPLMIFGIGSVTAGNWLWYTKKEIDNTVLMMICVTLITTFVVLILKTIA